MKIDLDIVLKGTDDADLTENGKPVILRDILVNSLMSLSKQDVGISGVDKYKRYELAMNLDGNLKSEDITLIKKLVGQMYTPLIIGRVYDILEKKEKPKKES